MFCFRLSFFPRGFGPGDRAGRVASGRAGGFGPGGLWAERANHLFNWRLGPVSPPVVQPVLQPVVQPSLQPKQSSVLQPLLQPKQSPVLQPFLQQPSNRRKVRFFNRSFNSPPTDAKSGPPTGGSFVPTTDAKFGPSTAPSTDAPDSHANAPQPKSLTMQRDSGRTASAILKNLCEVTHFYT